MQIVADSTNRRLCPKKRKSADYWLPFNLGIESNGPAMRECELAKPPIFAIFLSTCLSTRLPRSHRAKKPTTPPRKRRKASLGVGHAPGDPSWLRPAAATWTPRSSPKIPSSPPLAGRRRRLGPRRRPGRRRGELRARGWRREKKKVDIRLSSPRKRSSSCLMGRSRGLNFDTKGISDEPFLAPRGEKNE